MKGYVYILTNEHMPGLVKIGRTTTDPESRAAQLYQTGVPSPFSVRESQFSPDCAQLESAVHKELDGCRVSGAREFFRIDPDEAAHWLRSLHKEQVQDWMQEFLPEHVPVEADLCVAIDDIMMKAMQSGEPDPVIAEAMAEATIEELKPAIARVYARMERWRAKNGAEP